MFMLYDNVLLCRYCHNRPHYLKQLGLWFCPMCKRLGRVTKVKKVSQDIIDLRRR